MCIEVDIKFYNSRVLLAWILCFNKAGWIYKLLYEFNSYLGKTCIEGLPYVFKNNYFLGFSHSGIVWAFYQQNIDQNFHVR